MILGAGLLAGALVCQTANAANAANAASAANAANAANTACPAPGAAVVEQVIAADCPDCWAADAPAPAGAWRFDWISAAGDDAALSAAALAEATDRLQRRGAAAGARIQPARALPGLALKVGAGPAWQGYFGLQMTVRARSKASLPAGATGWLALVELLPAGSEGSAGSRALVRSVAGPLPLDGATSAKGLNHLRALRWPAGAQPERLQARGWIEAADGSLLAVAAHRCP